MALSEEQIQRYARHILLPEIGGIGQERLLTRSALIIGAGGLGSPLLMYLAAAGIGRIGIVDADIVDLSNLQRQVIHQTHYVGLSKVDSAKNFVNAMNPDIKIETHQKYVDKDNIINLISDYDIVADGTDNFASRFLINDACYLASRKLVSAAVLRFDGQLSTFKAFEPDVTGQFGPCYRCIFNPPPPADVSNSCSEAGVLGALCGVMGSLQAVEVIKELLDVGDSLSGILMLYEGLTGTLRRIKVKPDPECQLCGESPTITDLSIHSNCSGENA